MRLSMTNLAWDLEWEDELLGVLTANGYSGVELAPTKKFGAWQDISIRDVEAYKVNLRHRGLTIPAFQSVLFGLEGSFFDMACADTLLPHFSLLAELADAADCRVLIVGSPSWRRLKNRTYADGRKCAAEIFRLIGDILEPYDIRVGIESNPPEYGCDFLTTQAEVAGFVDEVAHRMIQEHLDLGAMLQNGDEDLASHLMRRPVHMHVSVPGLGSISDGDASPRLERMLSNMPDVQHWISIEALNLNSIQVVERDIAALAGLVGGS